MVQDHEEIFEELQEEMRRERVRAQQKKGTTAKPPEKSPSPSENIEYPTPNPKRAKPTVKIAKAGGLMTASKRGDGCAIRGKTKGRMV